MTVVLECVKNDDRVDASNSTNGGSSERYRKKKGERREGTGKKDTSVATTSH